MNHVHKCPDCGEITEGYYEKQVVFGVAQWWFCGNCMVGIPAAPNGDLLRVTVERIEDMSEDIAGLAMKVYLVCDVISHPEEGHVMGYDPSAAFATLEDAKTWSVETAYAASHKGFGYEWRTDEEGHSVLYSWYTYEHMTVKPGEYHANPSGLVVVTAALAQTETRKSQEHLNCAILEMEVSEYLRSGEVL